ncbi:MIZ/SP-RING zinc finger-domain-containing protein [Chytridium lagenaria]|nr:MIZ/SP-RING zinc finger-domain-containing protein [Chytridium lagenaria]
MDQLDVEQERRCRHAQYLSLRPSTPRDLTALRRQALENVALDNKVMDRKASSGDVEIGDSIVSFMCPLTLVRIEHPAKGADCKHVQCFDLKSFCAMLNLGSFWKCSVCGRVLRPSSIVLDIPFLRLLKAYPNDTKCIVKPDGTDAPFHNSHEDGIDITEDPPERCDTPETDRSHLQITSSQSSPAGLKRKAVEVIDVDSFDADVFVMRTKMRSPEEAKVGTKMIVSIDID